MKLVILTIQYILPSRASSTSLLYLSFNPSLVLIIHRFKPLRAMDTFWNRPSATAPVQPAMEIATSRMLVISHWLSTNKHVKIGLAIAVPGLVLILTTTPITTKLAQAWKRATEQKSPKKDFTRPERAERDTNDKPPKLPKKSYGQLPSERKTTRPERSEPVVNKNNNILFNNKNSVSRPESPKKSYAAAAAATTPATPTGEPFSPLTPDSASINSESSFEHSRKEKFKFGKNMKKRWQNRPFGHGHGSSESPLSP